MGYYQDLDESRGIDAEVERDFQERNFEENRKKANQATQIRREVKRQLKAQGISLTKPKRGACESVKCVCCHVEFQARVADIKRGWGKYCSKSCKAKKQRYNGYLHR